MKLIYKKVESAHIFRQNSFWSSVILCSGYGQLVTLLGLGYKG